MIKICINKIFSKFKIFGILSILYLFQVNCQNNKIDPDLKFSKEEDLKLTLIMNFINGSLKERELIDEMILLHASKEVRGSLESIDTSFSTKTYIPTYKELLKSFEELYYNNIETIGKTILVKSKNDVDTITIKNCQDFFTQNKIGYQELKKNQRKNKLSFKNRCEVINSILSYKPAAKSYINFHPFEDRSAWKQNLLFFDENWAARKIIGKSINILTIEELVALGFVEVDKVTSYAIRVSFGNYIQGIAELFRGDFNNDGIEDIMIMNKINNKETSFEDWNIQIWTKKSKDRSFTAILN